MRTSLQDVISTNGPELAQGKTLKKDIIRGVGINYDISDLNCLVTFVTFSELGVKVNVTSCVNILTWEVDDFSIVYDYNILRQPQIPDDFRV